MTKEQAKKDITAIAKRLNKTFIEIAETIIEQTPNCRSAKIVRELIKENLGDIVCPVCEIAKGQKHLNGCPIDNEP